MHYILYPPLDPHSAFSSQGQAPSELKSLRRSPGGWRDFKSYRWDIPSRVLSPQENTCTTVYTHLLTLTALFQARVKCSLPPPPRGPISAANTRVAA